MIRKIILSFLATFLYGNISLYAASLTKILPLILISGQYAFTPLPKTDQCRNLCSPQLTADNFSNRLGYGSTSKVVLIQSELPFDEFNRAVSRAPEKIFEYVFNSDDVNGITKIQIVENVLTLYMDELESIFFIEDTICNCPMSERFDYIGRIDMAHSEKHKSRDELDIRHIHIVFQAYEKIPKRELKRFLNTFKRRQYFENMEPINNCLSEYNKFSNGRKKVKPTKTF